MTNEDIKKQIEIELAKRQKSIHNKNAIDKFLGLLSRVDPTGISAALNALWGVLTGSRQEIELEKQKLTLEKILDLIVAIDDKLIGKDSSNTDIGLKILIENAISGGNITGLEGNTSDENIRKIFDKPLDIQIKNATANGNITGVKLNVDGEMQAKQQIRVETDFGIVETNPQLGEITFGEGFSNIEPKDKN